MLRKIFNKAATLPYLPEKPVVMVSTLHDDKNRGDSHGYIGMGKIVAEKLGGDYHYIDEDVLMERYPHSGNIEEQLGRFIADTGMPDILFTRYYSDFRTVAEKLGGTPFLIDDINENLTPMFSPLKKLVAHHLTPSLLQEEGQKFDAAYPGLKRPLVAVLLADELAYQLPDLLPSRMQVSGPSTVFICSGRRTSPHFYDALLTRMKAALEQVNDGQNQVLGYEFHEGRKYNAYNPYMGLLNRADHIIVCGDSMSIVSEALATGKSIHLYQNFDSYDTFVRKGYVSIFNEAAKGKPLETNAMTPLNRTENIADRIIRQYRHTQQRKLGLVGAIGAYLMDG